MSKYRTETIVAWNLAFSLLRPFILCQSADVICVLVSFKRKSFIFVLCCAKVRKVERLFLELRVTGVVQKRKKRDSGLLASFWCFENRRRAVGTWDGMWGKRDSMIRDDERHGLRRWLGCDGERVWKAKLRKSYSKLTKAELGEDRHEINASSACPNGLQINVFTHAVFSLDCCDASSWASRDEIWEFLTDTVKDRVVVYEVELRDEDFFWGCAQLFDVTRLIKDSCLSTAGKR